MPKAKLKPKNKQSTANIQAGPTKAWIVAVDMGYGHQRPANALRHLAHSPVITANTYPGIPDSDRSLWVNSQKFYEYISRMKNLPLVGNWLFGLFDKFQSIGQYYPIRDLSRPNIPVQQMYRLLKKGWGKHLIEKLSRKPTPLITTFFAVAFMAEYHNYPGEIYCLTTDTDISRAWAPLEPQRTRIRYFASTDRAYHRLREYGIPEKNIYLTGFPLPKENIGDERLTHLKARILQRLKNLDPEHAYLKKHYQDMARYLGAPTYPEQSDHPLTIAFAIGGAGAQAELGLQIVQSLSRHLCDDNTRIVLVAATHQAARDYYQKHLKLSGLGRLPEHCVEILYEPTKDRYFKSFNKVLDTIDVLWTKPSELCFFAGLGIPIILSPTIGAQEDSNRRWLLNIGAGFDQHDPRYTNEWFLDWVQSGFLAQAAMEGFIEAPYLGTMNIERVLQNEPLLAIYETDISTRPQ